MQGQKIAAYVEQNNPTMIKGRRTIGAAISEGREINIIQLTINNDKLKTIIIALNPYY